MDLADWRKKIDQLDRELVRLLNERARCQMEIGKIKRRGGLPIEASSREEKIFENIRSSNQGPLDDAALRGVFERILEESKRLQRRLGEAEGAANE